MRRLLYISSAKSAPTSDDIEDILRVSRRNNAAAGVTGLLVSGGRRFLQTLAGPDEAVEATFQRILKDPRHYAIVTLNESEIETPAFADWSMGHQAGAEAAEGLSLKEQVAAIVAPLSDANLRAYFMGFAARHSL